ncbi:MAG TPA: GNAT family N-acetyltransferase [Steroidobacteraceae bacterium]|nr:GNAT family N-acetyltransferase [Steroidobacteraceae bacterium]
MDDYRFELASPRDAADIAALSRQLIETGLPPAWPADRVLCHIRRTDSVVLTARSQDPGIANVAGFAIMQFGDTRAHLNLLAVDSAHQRRGLGRRLMNCLHESAMMAGVFDLSLELRANNLIARRFYAALGYQAHDLVRGYYRGVEDALRMRRDLRVGHDLTA